MGSDQPATRSAPEGVPVVGIVGGGQLARMLIEAASPLGVEVRVIAGSSDEGADGVAVDLIRASPDDEEAMLDFASGVDVLTFDHENVGFELLAQIEAAGTRVYPGIETMRLADKAHQRRELSAAGLPVPPFVVVDTADRDALGQIEAFFDTHAHAHSRTGTPDRIVLKASRGGYDGRGVWVLGRAELSGFLDTYAGAPLVVEPLLDLEAEFAVLVARNPSGQTAVWPVVETVQVDGMCDEVLMPASMDPELVEEATRIGRTIAEGVGSVGVFAVELFLTGGGLVINEVAPRVHNSGHVTIEGSVVSQFEQHIRAILDWPLGSTESVGAVAVMRNVVSGGGSDPRLRQGLALETIPEAHIHLYGKTPRAGRKIGHVTVLGTDMAQCRKDARTAADALSG